MNRGMLRLLSCQWYATVYVAAISAGVTFYLARSLGPGSFGVYSYFLAVASVIAAVQDGGFRTLLVREKTATSPALRAVAATLPHAAIGNNLLVTAVVAVVIGILPIQDKEVLLAALLCFSLFMISQTVSAMRRGEGRFIADAWWQIGVRSAMAIAIVGFAMVGGLSPLGIFIAWSAGTIVALIVGARGLLAWPSVPDYRALYRDLVPFAVIDVATTIYFKIDIVMLRHLLDDARQVGYYSAAYKVLEGVILLLTPVSYVCFRALRQSWQDKARFAWLFRRMTGGMLLGAVGIILMVGLAGTWMIRIVYGEAYAMAAELLFWLSLSLFFMMPNYILTQAAIADNRSASYAWITLAASIGNVGMNLLLIPRYGAVGAAWATIASEALMFGLLLVVFRRYLSPRGMPA